MAKALHKDFNYDVVYQCALNDWQKDISSRPDTNKPPNLLGYPSFVDSMFEIADVWTDSLVPQKYVDFLSHLFDRVSVIRNSKVSYRRLEDITSFYVAKRVRKHKIKVDHNHTPVPPISALVARHEAVKRETISGSMNRTARSGRSSSLLLSSEASSAKKEKRVKLLEADDGNKKENKGKEEENLKVQKSRMRSSSMPDLKANAISRSQSVPAFMPSTKEKLAAYADNAGKSFCDVLPKLCHH
jgi:hypothetical protein